MPRTIGSHLEFRERVKTLPEKVKFAILASKLASAIVYQDDTNGIYVGMIEVQ